MKCCHPNTTNINSTKKKISTNTKYIDLDKYTTKNFIQPNKYVDSLSKPDLANLTWLKSTQPNQKNKKEDIEIAILETSQNLKWNRIGIQTWLSFCQDVTCFMVDKGHRFRVYTYNPIQEMLQWDVNDTSGSIVFVKMLFWGHMKQ